ncbi:MAG TPA: sugar nucleotide-binding protein [Pseudomonadota bacterium]|nr:sugar nucleotide-binding protein [Pseudomonadota bacterium]
MPSKVVLLGASGCFGHMAAAVLGGTQTVLACGRRPGLVPFSVDDSDDKLRQLLLRAGPGAVVVNAIAMLASDIRADDAASLERAIQTNALFPQRLSRLASEEGARVLHVSTDAVFSANRGWISEDDAPDPEDAYGRSKLLGESGAGHVLSLRCSIVGPDPSRRRGLWEWLASQPRGARLRGFTDQLWSGLTTRQLALACAALLPAEAFARARAAGPVLHVAPNPVLSKFQLLSALGAVLRPDLIVEPAEASKPACRLLKSRSPGLIPLSTEGWPAELAAMLGQLPTTPTLH